jgi:hypothetical protein
MAIADRPRPRLEALARLDRLHETLAAFGEAHVGALLVGQAMREQPQGLDRRHERIATAKRVAQQRADFRVAVEEHVFLAREVVEHGHAADSRGGGDVVHGHAFEAAFAEQARCGVRDPLSGLEPLAGSERC